MTSVRRVPFLLLPLGCAGCQLLGTAASGISQLFNLAIWLAMAAAPFVLSYYLYKRGR